MIVEGDDADDKDEESDEDDYLSEEEDMSPLKDEHGNPIEEEEDKLEEFNVLLHFAEIFKQVKARNIQQIEI